MKEVQSGARRVDFNLHSLICGQVLKEIEVLRDGKVVWISNAEWQSLFAFLNQASHGEINESKNVAASRFYL